jgi:trimeric autotransporter adhesin
MKRYDPDVKFCLLTIAQGQQIRKLTVVFLQKNRNLYCLNQHKMKRSFYLTIFCLLWLNVVAQVPLAFKYQAVVRDITGNVLSNRIVSFRISILGGSATGSTFYTEDHSGITSNAFGLVDLEIGKGTVVTGSFQAINWDSNTIFMKVEMDPNGGTAYQAMGASQLLSVPYALHAKKVEEEGDGDATNELQVLSINGNQLTLSRQGGTVTLPAGGTAGDQWGTQVVATDGTLTGNGLTVTPLKVADNGITSAKILDGSILTTDLADQTVSSAKLGNLAVSVEKIQNGAVVSDKLAGNAVTTAKINAGAVTGDKIAQSGAVNGQVLKWDNGNWVPSNDLTGGFTLPYSGSITTQGKAFIITNSSSGDGTYGIYGLTDSSTGYNIAVAGKSNSTTGVGIEGSGFTGVSGFSSFSNGYGVLGLTGSYTGINYGVKGETSSPDGYGVFGLGPVTGIIGKARSTSGDTYGIIGESVSNTGKGIFGKTTSVSGQNYGVYGENASSEGSGVHGTSKAGLGVGVSGTGYYGMKGSGEHYGVYGEAAKSSGSVCGVYGYTYSPDGEAVSGINNSGSGEAVGVFGQSSSNTGKGVYGLSPQTGVFGFANVVNAATSYGVYGKSSCYTGSGVYGQATSTTGTNYGVYGESGSVTGYGMYGTAPVYGLYGVATNGTDYAYGVYGKTGSSTGRGVKGEATATTGYAHGIYGSTAANNGDGVYGIALHTTGANYGGYFTSLSSSGYGIFCDSPMYGAYGKSTGTKGRAVIGEATGTASIGVYGKATNTNSTGVWGEGSNFDFYANGPGTDYGTGSSIRWKRNIVPISQPITKILAIRGVYFDWDEQHGGQHDVGMIAEEVGKVLPEIVVYEKNGIDACGMDYSKITPLLLEAIKAQQAKIESLESRLSKLESLIGTTSIK